MEDSKRQQVRRKRKNLDKKKTERSKNTFHKIRQEPRAKYSIPPSGIRADEVENEYEYDDLS